MRDRLYAPLADYKLVVQRLQNVSKIERPTLKILNSQLYNKNIKKAKNLFKNKSHWLMIKFIQNNGEGLGCSKHLLKAFYLQVVIIFPSIKQNVYKIKSFWNFLYEDNEPILNRWFRVRRLFCLKF